MTGEAIRTFCDSWAMGWTVVLILGYVGPHTRWPWLSALRSPTANKAMVVSTLAVVLFLTLVDERTASSTVTAWVILFSSLNWLFHWLNLAE